MAYVWCIRDIIDYIGIMYDVCLSYKLNII